MSSQKYAYGDTVKLTELGQLGIVQGVHHGDAGHTYQVKLEAEPARVVEAAEADLELVKLANAEETGLSPDRYIT